MKKPQLRLAICGYESFDTPNYLANATIPSVGEAVPQIATPRQRDLVPEAFVQHRRGAFLDAQCMRQHLGILGIQTRLHILDTLIFLHGCSRKPPLGILHGEFKFATRN